MGRGGPGDKEGVQVGKEIGVFEGRRVLWECRNLNPSENSLVFANSVCDWELFFFFGFCFVLPSFWGGRFLVFVGGWGWGLALRLVVVVVVVHCGRVLQKTVFIKGEKVVTRRYNQPCCGHSFGCPSLLFFLTCLCFFYFITYLPWVFFFFFFCRFDWFALCFSNPWILFVGTWDPILRISTELHRSFCHHWYLPRSTWLPPLIYLFLLYLVFSFQSFFQQI